MTINIKTFSLDELKALGQEKGWPSFRVGQLFEWIYQRGATSYDEMTNLPKALRTELETDYPLSPPTLANKQVSSDGSRKYLICFPDGASVETVGIPSRDKKRLSVCISTQVGCAMGCLFCATAQQSFERNLLPGEIVDQVLLVQKDFDTRVSNVVVMGQGEPFLNYTNTLAGLRILNHQKGLAIGARHITVSTCGIIPGIEKFAQEPEQFTLAISLHAANQRLRDKLMPGLKKYPLKQLKNALLDYQAEADRRITIEYVMISDANDSLHHLKELQNFCRGLHCHINLLPFNSFPDSPLTPTLSETLKQWTSELSRVHIEATVRDSRGSDISGACGQLNIEVDER